MNSLTPMTRVETIAPAGIGPALHELIRAAGATGYTTIGAVSGLGHSGPHNGPRLFNDRDSLSMTITVLPPTKAPALIEAIRALLDRHSGVVFVSETLVSRPDYFQ